MLKISLFPQIFQSLCLRKKDKSYIYILRITQRYNTLKSHKKYAHTELIFRFSGLFKWFLLCFLFPVCFYIFHLAKLLLALKSVSQYFESFDVIPNFTTGEMRVSMLYQVSPQVKWWAIITYKHGIYELPHELPNDLRLTVSGNQEILGNCLNFIE